MELSQASPEASAILVPGGPARDDTSDTDSHVSFNEDDLPDGICDEYAGVSPVNGTSRTKINFKSWGGKQGQEQLFSGGNDSYPTGTTQIGTLLSKLQLTGQRQELLGGRQCALQSCRLTRGWHAQATPGESARPP